MHEWSLLFHVVFEDATLRVDGRPVSATPPQSCKGHDALGMKSATTCCRQNSKGEISSREFGILVFRFF